MDDSIENEKKELRKIKNQTREAVISNESLFENKLTYITGGALAISLTFIKDIVKLSDTDSLFLLITSWAILTFTLFLNLLSCPLSAKLARRIEGQYATIINNEDISLECFLCEKKKIFKNNKTSNKIITNINWACVGGLSLGIICMLTFASINISK